MRGIPWFLILAGCSSGSSMPAVPKPMNDGMGDVVATSSVKYPDLRALYDNAIVRTCGPNSGVCHNSKQFPDMQTMSGLLGAIGKRCNEIRDQPAAVDNLCEPPGDFLELGSFKAHIGNVTPNGATVDITLDAAMPQDLVGQMPSILRSRPPLADVKLAFPAKAVLKAAKGSSTVTLDMTIISDPLQAPAPPPANAMGNGVKGSVGTFLVPPEFLPGDDTQVELGDPNGDGVFGASLGGAVIQPGKPLQSYLFLRVLGPLAIGNGSMMTSTTAPPSTEAQMPIANNRYWDTKNTVTALWCWISGMSADGSNADGPIDWAHCDASAMPLVTLPMETAATYSAVYEQVIQPSCVGPCHHDGYMSTSLHLGDAQTTYGILLGFHGEHPSENMTMPFITKGDPTKSFLYLKIKGDPSAGTRMPLGGMLPQESIDAVGAWILQGANND